MPADLILYDAKNNYFGIDYKEIKFSNMNELKKSKLNIVQGNTINRDILENKNIDILVNPELGLKKDSLHFRNSGLNKILCNLARKNNIIIGFSFSNFLNSRDRSLLLGRMMQNVRLCRKFKVKMIVASFATDEFELRSIDTLRAFSSIIGMNPGEFNKSQKELEILLKKVYL